MMPFYYWIIGKKYWVWLIDKSYPRTLTTSPIRVWAGRLEYLKPRYIIYEVWCWMGGRQTEASANYYYYSDMHYGNYSWRWKWYKKKDRAYLWLYLTLEHLFQKQIDRVNNDAAPKSKALNQLVQEWDSLKWSEKIHRFLTVIS